MNIIMKLFKITFTNPEGIKRLLDEAKTYEELKEYEDATYSYACAIYQGAEDQKYKDKIKQINKNYGPFNK
jgi:hypothetical protein